MRVPYATTAVALALALGACTDDTAPVTAPPAPQPAADGVSVNDTDGDLADATVELDTGPDLEGTLIQGLLRDFWTDGPIEGAEICVEDDDELPCVWSGADGMYYLSGLEAQSLIVLTVAAPDAYTMRFPMNTNAGVTWDFHVPSREVVDVLLVSLGAEIEDQNVVGGFISISYSGETTEPDIGLYQGDFLEGMSVLLEPQVGVGPFYFTDGLPDPAATGTDDSGIAAAGNLPGGAYTVRFQHSARACKPGQGLAADDSGWTPFEIVPGHQTIVTAICAEPPEGGVGISGVLSHLSNSEPAAAVSVCLRGHPEVPCSLSSEDGAYGIVGAPEDSPVLLEIDGPGLRSQISPLHTAGDTKWNAHVFTSEVHAWLYESIGLTPEEPDEVGDLLLQVYDAVTLTDGSYQGQGVDGVHLEVASDAGAGAYYFSGGVPSTQASATDATGLGLVPSLPVGSYEVVLEHPDRACGPGAGIPGSAGKAIGVEIWPGTTTVLTAQCEAPEVQGATIEGVVTDFASGAGAAGVTICLEGAADVPCGTTDDDGSYLLQGAPINEEVVVTLEGQDLRPMRTHLSTAEGVTWDNRVISDQLHAWILGTVGVPPVDSATVGDLVLVAYDESTFPVGAYQGAAMEGVSLWVEPAPANGPFYFDEDDAPSAEATATHSLGIGFVPNLPPGTYTVGFSHLNHKCVVGNGLTPTGDSSHTLEVVAGAITIQAITCYPLNPDGVSITGVISDFGTGEPAEEVLLCLEGYEDIPCSVTDADGGYTLWGAPPDTVVEIVLSGWGYKDIRTWLYTGSGVSWSSPMIAGTLHEQVLGLVGVNPENPFDHGDFVMRAYDATTVPEGAYQGTPQAGVAFALTPADGDGPFYFAADLGTQGTFPAPIPSATATATDDLGLGFIANVSPGDYTLTCTHPNKTCAPGQGLSLSEDAAATFKLSPGGLTVITCLCE